MQGVGQKNQLCSNGHVPESKQLFLACTAGLEQLLVSDILQQHSMTSEHMHSTTTLAASHHEQQASVSEPPAIS